MKMRVFVFLYDVTLARDAETAGENDDEEDKEKDEGCEAGDDYDPLTSG
jgi:hypothetical protein